MIDSDQGVDRDVDRSELNIRNDRASNKKTYALVGFVFVSILILSLGFYLFFSKPNNIDSSINEVTQSTGSVTDIEVEEVSSTEQFFENIKKKNELRKRLEEKERLRLLEENKKKNAEPVVIQNSVPEVKREVIKVKPQPTIDSVRANKNQSKKQKEEITPEMRKLSGEVMVNIDSSAKGAEFKEDFNNKFTTSSFSNGYALARPKGSLDFMLMHGTSIPCTLYTQIISDYEGYVTCIVRSDVYSANGAALLVERGSLVSGSQSVTMELGKARIFTTWADIETPLGVSIKIDSLGTGELGASGTEAWIDNHYMERFGGAILLSFIDDAIAIASDRASSNSEITLDSTSDNASDMASQALESSIGIKPTGYSKIGQRINIMVVRDIDMSSVYQFEAL